MQMALDVLEGWCDKWSVHVSIEKTVTLLISIDPAENNVKI
jgi:hypothetical protein